MTNDPLMSSASEAQASQLLTTDSSGDTQCVCNNGITACSVRCYEPKVANCYSDVYNSCKCYCGNY